MIKKVSLRRKIQLKEGNRKHHKKLKMIVLKHYSPELKCQKCGFSDVRALTIDHKMSNGKSHRKKISKNKYICSSRQVYNWIIKNDFPNGVQVLCMNCQLIKEIERRDRFYYKRLK